jgi:hypothetical protein
MTWLATTATVVLLGVVAGCGSSTGSSGSRRDDPSGDASALSATTPPTLGQSASPPSGPSDQIKPRTLRGTVVQGAQPDCLELVSPPSRWVLLGVAARDLQPGDEVEIIGRPAPQLSTSCSGVPLQVRTVRHL